MRKARAKKLVLFICEGPTDENALYLVMKSFFNPSEVKFHIVHGDFFLSSSGKAPKDAIEDILSTEMKRYALRRSDVLAVFHATDTDGAFIPDEMIVEDADAHRIRYESDCIRTKFVSSIAARNRKKRKNLDVLSGLNCLGNDIPYRIYYFSHNIEHALYGIGENLNDNRKSDLSDEFADRFSQNWRDFYSYVVSECGPLGTNYKSSWDEIRKDNASLMRHTNINLLFEEFGYVVWQ